MKHKLFVWIGRLLLLGCFGMAFARSLPAQSDPFQLTLNPVEIAGMPALQSFVWGQANGKWLLMGGRTDGLHRRQPFASFDSLGHHRQLVVVDPRTGKVWSAPLTTLPVPIQDQLSATNLQFLQVGKSLHLIGGYGYCATLGDHRTYPYLTVVDVPAVIQAVVEARPLGPHFRQVEDTVFAVTGGQLERIGDTFYLVGGQDFEGRYNPMGPDHGPGFVQRYNHNILQFDIRDDGSELKVEHRALPADTLKLHRRDYNMLPQILPDGSEGLMAFSGVFQYGVNLPWFDCLDIGPEGHQTIDGFMQHYNHYHCAKVALHSARDNAMHNVFFGGIAAYYDSLGTLTFHRDVPFVKTISRLTRTADGKMEEYRLPVEMPDYLGSSAEFIPQPDLPCHPNGVLKLDELGPGPVSLGYIVGGIQSKDDNVFWVNEGEHSQASARVFEVILQRGGAESQDVRNVYSSHPLQLQVLPSYSQGTLTLDFQMAAAGKYAVELRKGGKKLVLETGWMEAPAGPVHVEKACKALTKGGNFLLLFRYGDETIRQFLVVEP